MGSFGKPKFSVFEKLCEERNVTPYRVAKETGVSTPTLSQWKKKCADPQSEKTYYPKMDKIMSLAKYFDVSVGVFYE